MSGKTSLFLAYILVAVFIIYMVTSNAQYGNGDGWELINRAFKWVTNYIVPWCILGMLVVIYRKMK